MDSLTQGAHHGCQGTQDGFVIALVIGVVGIVKKFFKKSLRNLHDVEAFRDEVVGVLDIIGVLVCLRRVAMCASRSSEVFSVEERMINIVLLLKSSESCSRAF